MQFLRWKTILPIIVSFCPLPGNSQGTWERIGIPTTQNLNSVYFTDSLTGWVVGDSGTILHTSDGGSVWICQDSPTDHEIVSVFFLNSLMGWASAFNYSIPPYGTILLSTIDGGITWESEPFPEENIFITCIYYFDSLTGWMGGKPHALVKTTNGGTTWTQAAIDTSTLAFFPVLSLTFLNEEIGFACGGMFDIAGVIWHTSNGGELWYAIDPSQAPADEVHALHIFDEIHVMGSGGDPDYGYGVGMIRSSDGGLNWTYEDIGIQGIAFDLDFRTRSEAWAPLGPQQKLIYSLDSGSTWTEILAPDSASIFGITFPDSLHGYAVGNNGVILTYHPPVIPDISTPPGGSGAVSLVQNFPNPFHDHTTIIVQSYLHGRINLTIHDVTGYPVVTLIDGNLPPGNHQVVFNGEALSPGIYFLRILFNQSYSMTKRMVILP